MNILDDAGAQSEREASGDSAVSYKDLTSLGLYQGYIWVSLFRIFNMISTNTEMDSENMFYVEVKRSPRRTWLIFVAHCNGVTD